ncbi:MAG: ferric reductase-like transmembrane domain-containing protein [Pseudomonadota bacterium]
MTARAALIWAALLLALVVPVAVAATSPLLAWRQPIYIAAGFAGVVAMGLLLLQPLLVGGYLPGLGGRRGRRLHGWVGAGLVAAVLLHIGALWVTSPPDVVDALLLRSPTPFSLWGVIATWAMLAAALLALLRRRLRWRPALWRLAHAALAAVVAAGSVAHALLIEGTMGTLSKVVLCALVLAAAAKLMLDIRPWALLRRRRA